MIDRILFTESSNNLGGQELQALQQMVALEEMGVKTQLVCRENSGIAERAALLGLLNLDIPFRNSLHVPSMLALRRLIQAWHPQAIISHSGHDANITALATRYLPQRPVLVRSRTYQPGQPKTWTYNRFADVTVVPSAELRREILANPRIAPERVQVLYPGIDFDTLERAAKASLPQDVASWLNQRTGPLVVQAAMLRPEKGHLFMLDVIAQISSRFAGLRYVIAGNGEQRERIAARISELGLAESVMLAGLMNPVAPLLKCADLVVMPSFYEPLGMAQSEALALGVPVVASKVGGIPETVADGETGLLVEPGNLHAWTDALTWALGNLPRMRQMAQDGGKRVRSQFSVEANLAKLLQAIDFASQGRRSY
ncbi:MAG: glycosyltransferase family 4 protein [Rhodocyclaceae bacterium]|nr:glycosyltransferase family 4 protein [Rhodocyclaceae bacterium]